MKIKSPKKLIEVALPLDDINAAAAREKSIRHGHPSTLHLYWARRPLAAARAVIFAQMVNAPGWQHEVDGTTPSPQQKAACTRRRNQLFEIIRDLVKWENTNNEEVLEKAREAIRESWRETCEYNKGVPGFDPEKLPAFHDPFAGGGAIPLEAQRLGLEAYASDLNPVAVMINKAMIEIPPKFAGRAPVGADVLNAEKQRSREVELTGWDKKWKGAEGLAEDVRRYGAWMRTEAQKKIGHLYPQVEVTKEMAKDRPDLKDYIGKKLTVIAWLWARTVKSPNPAFADVDVPLVSSFILSSKKGKEAYVEPVIDGKTWHFEVRVGTSPKGAEMGTKLGRGAKFKCLMSGAPMDEDYVRAEGVQHRMGTRLMAIVAEGERGRIYLAPNEEHEKIAREAQPSWRPATKMAENPRWFSPPAYGMTTYGDIFTDRQLVALNTFSDLVAEARTKAIEDAIAAGWADDGKRLAAGGTGATAYGDALAVYLTFGVSRLADIQNSICSWETSKTQVRHMFTRQAIPMMWDFGENNLFCHAAGDYETSLGSLANVIENFKNTANGFSNQADAQTQTYSQNKLISTDPPYYDNIGYADLSDFFYIWLRRGLRDVFSAIFASMTTPKTEELVATPYRHGGKEDAELFFMNGMTATMHNLARISTNAFPATIYYAFKQSETSEEGMRNAGWETFLEAVITAGFAITGTWPMRTELANRMIGSGTNALASSIVLVCRKRSADAPSVSRAQFTRELKRVMFDALRDMTGTERLDDTITDIAPVDLAQAAIGPGMGVYSKYASVLKPDGSRLSVHEAMTEINREIERVLDPDNASYDPETNVFVNWYKEFGFEAGEFGKAEVLAKAKGTTVARVVGSGVAESSGGKFRVLAWQEYPEDAAYDPQRDDNLPLWEALHRVVKALETTSTRKTAKLLARMEGKVSADDIRQLAYYLYTYNERKGDAAQARAYNALVTAWSDLAQLVAELHDQEGEKLTQGELGI